MHEKSDTNLQKPVPIWERPIEIGFRDVGAALAKIGSAIILQEWLNVADGVVDIVSALGISARKPDELAWLLIYRALLQAMVSISHDHPSLTKQEVDLDLLCGQIDLTLEKSSITLSNNFFEQPKQLPILEVVIEAYRQWLITHRIPEADAKSISERLPQYFVYELNRQWGQSVETYEVLRKELDTPFSKANAREQAWACYFAWLQKCIDEPMFGEAFSLRQIYIPLRAYYIEKFRKSGSDKIKRQVRVVVDLESALDNWLSSQEREDAIRVICGGPGCGKSSFTKIWAAKVAYQGHIPVLRIPLFQIDPSKDLVDAIEDWIQSDLDNLLPPNPLTRKNA
ncbi:MAG: hypothetical protein F6K11_05410 [Leptolyngbya sp. SIO3F4]|nr:hypothetical protein [Leptolyngbya sp. SIO3F4]